MSDVKLVKQNQFGPRGNCYSACLASLLAIPLSEVPNFYDMADQHGDGSVEAWYAEVRKWLRSKGYGVMLLGYEHPEVWAQQEGVFIVSGDSPRNKGGSHATLWQDGVMIHDPHPDNTGIGNPNVVDFIYPLFTYTAPTVNSPVQTKLALYDCGECATGCYGRCMRALTNPTS